MTVVAGTARADHVGAELRFPTGPDDDGHYAALNWVALALAGSYELPDAVTLRVSLPLALTHPHLVALGTLAPRTSGGASMCIQARGLSLTAGYMRERAMLLSDKDIPLFAGDFEPGLSVSYARTIEASDRIDLSFQPSASFQAGGMHSHAGIQIPASVSLAVRAAVAVSVDVGAFSGDHSSVRGAGGARIAVGGSVSADLGAVRLHARVGVASLLVGGFYPTVGDSLYITLGVTYRVGYSSRSQGGRTCTPR